MTNETLTPAQGESADSCHISNQVQHDPKLPMDEARV